MKKFNIKTYLLILVLLLGTLSGCVSSDDSNYLSLKKKTFTIEYGDDVSTNPKTYIKASSKVLDDTKISIKNIKKENNYIKTGKYQACAKYKNEETDFTIHVEDTKKPEFIDFKKEIEVKQNSQDFNPTSYFKAIDHVGNDTVEANISIENVSSINMTIVGEYQVTIIATDENGNTAIQVSTFKVEPQESVSPIKKSSDVPAYNGQSSISVNNNVPFFTSDEKKVQTLEHYSDLDSLGRCGEAFGCLSIDTMPSEERGDIGMVKPSGWHTVKYDCVDGKYLYNRCHLIGYQLAGEKANVKNLMTGTRYLNTEGMLPYENKVADYIKSTKNHVLYRVTPIFDDNNLLASGVLMEAYSLEDQGQGIQFCEYVYNVQPGITINYSNGDSTQNTVPQLSSQTTQHEDIVLPTTPVTQNTNIENSYIINKNTGKFHYATCRHVKTIKEHNKETYTGSRDSIISRGYQPCKECNP